MAGTGKAHLRDGDDVVLRVEDLVVEFPAGRGRKVHAVSGISLDARVRETVGLVGESGCGKSSTGRAILQLPAPTGGSVRLAGTELTSLHGGALRRARAQFQMIFQDPISSLNPRRTVRELVREGMQIWRRTLGAPDESRVDDVLDAVGLDPRAVGDRRPYQLSGGQCQRVCIARALVLEPRVLLCDEPVSALDVSVQAQILNLLEDMKERYGLTLLFVAHDLAVVKRISDRIVVMYLGKICEVADPETLYSRPAHPYTALLLRSIPGADPARPDPVPPHPAPPGARRPPGDTSRPPGLSDVDIPAELPSPIDPPSGCRFRTRCPKAAAVCAEREPLLREARPGQYVACHFPE